MPIRGLVFDLFGTLVTRGDGWRAYRELIFRAPPWQWSRLRRAALTRPNPTIGEFRDELGIRRGPPSEHFERLVAEGLAAVELYPDSITTLERARAQGLKLALLSNLAAPYKAPVFEFGLDRHFDALVFSCEVGMAKPDAAIFAHVAARLELAVDELVMIGDSRHDDVRGAESAGMHALHLDRRGRGKRGSLRSLEEMFEQPVFEAR